MNISVTSQTMVFLAACVFGAALGALYDVFRIIRIAVPGGKAAVFFQDLLFWLICAVATFLFLLFNNAGEIRFFILLGELIGATLYYFTLGVLVMKSARALITAIRRFFAFLFRIVSVPIKFIAGLVNRFVNCIIKLAKNLIKKQMKVIKTYLHERSGKVYNLSIRNKNRETDINRKRSLRKKKRKGHRKHEKSKKK